VSDGKTLPLHPIPEKEHYFPFTFGCYRGCLFRDFITGQCMANGTGFSAEYDPIETLQTEAQRAALQQVYKIDYGAHSKYRPGSSEKVPFLHKREGAGSICDGVEWSYDEIWALVFLVVGSMVITVAIVKRGLVLEKEDAVVFTYNKITCVDSWRSIKNGVQSVCSGVQSVCRWGSSKPGTPMAASADDFGEDDGDKSNAGGREKVGYRVSSIDSVEKPVREIEALPTSEKVRTPDGGYIGR
jgi:hypothetical protein